MTANIKKLMWKSALAVLSISAITPNLSAAFSIIEDPVTEKFTVNIPSSMIYSIDVGSFSAGDSAHFIAVNLQLQYYLSSSSSSINYSFPESDINSINSIRPYAGVRDAVCAQFTIISDVTEPGFYKQYVADPKYNNDVHIFEYSTGADLGSITFGYSAVPEPSTYLAGLSALGMLGLFGYRNRK